MCVYIYGGGDFFCSLVATSPLCNTECLLCSQCCSWDPCTVCVLTQCVCVVQRLCVCAQPLSSVRLCSPTGCSPPGSTIHGISQAKMLEWLPRPTPGDLSDPGVEHVSESPALAGGFLTTSATWVWGGCSAIASSAVCRDSSSHGFCGLGI